MTRAFSYLGCEPSAREPGIGRCNSASAIGSGTSSPCSAIVRNDVAHKRDMPVRVRCCASSRGVHICLLLDRGAASVAGAIIVKPTDWSRKGASTVAGVTYQVAMTARLLVAGAVCELPIFSVTPEGDEDVDCELNDGARLLVQTKDRAGEDRVTVARVSDVLIHALAALDRSPSSRLALVTSGELGSGLSASGWEKPITDQLTADQIEIIRRSLNSKLGRSGEEYLSRFHIIRESWDLGWRTTDALSRKFDVPLGIAQLIHSRLLEDIALVASNQRSRARENAIVRRVSDLEAIARSILEKVDLSRLDEAISFGIVEPIDFTVPDTIEPEQFLQGIDVHPGHIAAGLDILRPVELDEACSALRRERSVTLLGPSGAGKSALLWRIAANIPGVLRRWRVLRLREADAPVLVRWVKLQEPSVHAPLLICCDDLGRPNTSGWPSALPRLLEIPGVLLLGAARQEDFHPELVRPWTHTIEPKLDLDLARRIADALEKRGVTTRRDPQEAFELSGTLLMEFLSLLLEGRRLADVVGAQVDDRLGPDRATEREILRFVCAAHVLGLSVPADALRTLVGSRGDLTSSLARLSKEHLLVSTARDSWIGLHALRSEIIHQRLHDLPPPVESDTYSKLLEHLGPDDRAALIERCAARPGVRMAAIADVVQTLAVSTGVTARSFAQLLRALRRAEAARYAAMCFAMGRDDVLAGDVYESFLVAFSIRFAGIEVPSERVNSLAKRLPEPAPSLVRCAAQHLNASRIHGLIADASIDDAIDLLEILERNPILSLDLETAQRIADRYRCESLEKRAQLWASLFVHCRVPPLEWSKYFGDIRSRIRALVDVTEDALAFSISEASSEGTTIAIDLIDQGTKKATLERKGELRGQILDICPEAQFVEIVVRDSDGQALDDRYMKSPRSARWRPADQRWNFDVVDALRRLSAARSWTERLRSQAKLATEAGTLLDEVAQRLLDRHDNLRRRKEWIKRARNLIEAEKRLPQPPLDDLDRTTDDPIKDGFGYFTAGLRQLADAVEAPPIGVRGAGACFRMAARSFTKHEVVSGPSLPSIGNPLPRSLIERLEEVGALGLVLATENARPATRKRGQAWSEAARELVDSTRARILAREQVEVSVLFPSAKISRRDRGSAEDMVLVADDWLVRIDLKDWTTAFSGLTHTLSKVPKMLAGRIILLLEIDTVVVPILALRIGSKEPMKPSAIIALCHEAKLRCSASPYFVEYEMFRDSVSHLVRRFACVRLRDPSLDSVAPSRALEEAKQQASTRALGFSDLELRAFATQIIAQLPVQTSEALDSLIVKMQQLVLLKYIADAAADASRPQT